MEKITSQAQVTAIASSIREFPPSIIYEDLALMEASIKECQGIPVVTVCMIFCDQLWIQIPSRLLKGNRRVRIGIKNARLQLKISNGGIPLSKRGLCHDFLASIPAQKEEAGSSETTVNMKLNLDSSAKTGVGFEAGSKNLTQNKISFQESIVQTKAGGSNTNPYWILMAKTQPCLASRLQTDLGEICIENKLSPCHITIELSCNCPAEDISVCECQSVWPEGATKARQWILKRIIEKELAPKLAAVLCRQELTYG
jgi:hypothetical protein